MKAYFPKTPDNNSLAYNNQVFITEGIKKSLAGCSHGIPTIGLWSTWCFCENGTNTPLVCELKDAITKCNDVYIVYDSDKFTKSSVADAEQALAEKIFLETSREPKILDLPSRVGEISTKGLDDYLLVQPIEEFYKLIKSASHSASIFTASRKRQSIPVAPITKMPSLLSAVVEDIKSKYEGCHEIAVMSLFASVAVCTRNKVKLDGKAPNLYMIGIADTVSGKSTVARKALSALNKIDTKLLREYMNAESIEEDIKEENSDVKP